MPALTNTIVERGRIRRRRRNRDAGLIAVDRPLPLTEHLDGPRAPDPARMPRCRVIPFLDSHQMGVPVETVQALFNIVLVVFIMATMLSAGFNTSVDQILGVLKRVQLVILVVLVAFVLRPLVGWGLAELFGLATPAFIAMALLWSCPGAPFGAKLVATAKADLQTGAVLQVLMASIASITFAPTANAIIAAADLGDAVTLPVADLIKTVAFLQLVPFVVGVLVRHWTPERALEWDQPVAKVSGLTFVAVVVGATLGSWRTIVDLIGSNVLIAALVASVIVLVLGYLVATGGPETRVATALVEPASNAGPAFAAVAIAFDNDPEILGAVVGIIFVQLVVGILTASYMGKNERAVVSAP